MIFTSTLRKLVVAAALVAAPSASFAGVFISVGFAPPVLPVYTQPLCPGDGYIWTPGYWGYGEGGYYWVPGVWVQPPTVGYLWTPGYWGFFGGQYRFNEGYWGPHVGFYGGVNYGFGYGGVGFEGRLLEQQSLLLQPFGREPGRRARLRQRVRAQRDRDQQQHARQLQRRAGRLAIASAAAGVTGRA